MEIETEDAVNVVAEKVITELNQLVVSCREYEENEYKSSNMRLYGILAVIMKNYLAVANDRTVLKAAVIKMKEGLAPEGIHIQGNTPVMTVFVRYIFRTNRQRALNYSRALMYLVREGIEPENIPDFIENNGGIDECKKAYSVPTSLRQREEIIRSKLPDVEDVLAMNINSPLATFSHPASRREKVGSNGYLIALVKPGEGDLVKVVALVPTYSAHAVKIAKEKMALYLHAELLSSAKSLLEAEREDAIENAACLAVQIPLAEMVTDVMAA